jgi:2-(1,2-epoxy-1,2-dihydrophenyl)acetyl-CoA isomerase
MNALMIAQVHGVTAGAGLSLVLLGDTLGAADAERLGLANRVVPAGRLEAETDVLAQHLRCGPTLAYGAMRRLMRESFDRSLPD